MYILLVFIFVLGLTLKGIERFLIHNNQLKRVASLFLNEYLIYIIAFNINNMGFSVGIHFRYLSSIIYWDRWMIGSWILNLISLIIIIMYALVLLYRNPKLLG
jgi:hypothetical protein